MLVVHSVLSMFLLLSSSYFFFFFFFTFNSASLCLVDTRGRRSILAWEKGEARAVYCRVRRVSLIFSPIISRNCGRSLWYLRYAPYEALRSGTRDFKRSKYSAGAVYHTSFSLSFQYGNTIGGHPLRTGARNEAHSDRFSMVPEIWCEIIAKMNFLFQEVYGVVMFDMEIVHFQEYLVFFTTTTSRTLLTIRTSLSTVSST